MDGKQNGILKNVYLEQKMKEILKAARKARKEMAGKRKKLKKKDIFENLNADIFDKRQDDFLKIKPHKRSYSSNVTKWTSHDIICYMREKTQSNRICFDAYEKREIARLQDRITKNLEAYTNDKNSRCNNNLLKKYLDWWLFAHKSQINEETTVELFCNEKNVREFFRSGSWIPLETPQSSSILSSDKMSSQEPSPELYSILYKAGGLKKLIYTAGIVDSYEFLILIKKKKDLQAKNELRKTLLTLHPAVFEHVLQKTLQRAPYPKAKSFDVFEVVKHIISKRKLIEFRKERFNCLFEEE